MRVASWLLLCLAVGCSPRPVDPGCPDCAAQDAGTDAGGEVNDAPIAPKLGTFSEAALDCTDRYTPPAALTGAEGLAHFGWTFDDLRFTGAWDMATRFETPWISDGLDAVPSARVRPWLVPAAGACFEQGLRAAVTDGMIDSAAVLAHASAFRGGDTGLDALGKSVHVRAGYDLSGGSVLARAIAGLYALPNGLPGAPEVPSWGEGTDAYVRLSADAWPASLQEPLARLVLAIGEAHLLKTAALEGAEPEAMARIHAQFLAESYTSVDNTFVSPKGGSVVADLIAQADRVDLTLLELAGQSVAEAADAFRAALALAPPFDAPPLELLTPHGLILLTAGNTDDTYDAARLADAALVIDVGGNDRYEGRFASTHRFWMGASVLVDGSGDDLYTPEAADLEAAGTSTADAFANATGFTQGLGLLGVGVLVDGGGTDVYTASVFAQGVGVFGVGLLSDVEGNDQYRVGNMGQGAGYFGLGVLVDAAGADDYRVYSLGQGLGKPRGLGLLLDTAGDDTYLAYHAPHPPELPDRGFKNYYGLPSSWAYNDGTRPHFMSLAQGVGWGYRGDWFADRTIWSGGFGALLDLGGGADQHSADTFSLGMGFVYGFGMFYDDGGDDRYRTFWWGPGAGAHMGTGLFWDEDGNDDLYVTRASAGFGFDWSVAWTLDRGGNDTYGGSFHYGESYTHGLTFFVNEGGDDVYNVGGARANPMFGGVRTGYEGVKLVGAFLDLGGGNDQYVGAATGIGNDQAWYPEPVAPLSGQSLDPQNHKGIGLDR